MNNRISAADLAEWLHEQYLADPALLEKIDVDPSPDERAGTEGFEYLSPQHGLEELFVLADLCREGRSMRWGPAPSSRPPEAD